MSTKIVKLKDAGSIFHDVNTGETLTGVLAKEIKNSNRVEKAIKGGALISLTEKEALAWNKEQGHDGPIEPVTAVEKPKKVAAPAEGDGEEDVEAKKKAAADAKKAEEEAAKAKKK